MRPHPGSLGHRVSSLLSITLALSGLLSHLSIATNVPSRKLIDRQAGSASPPLPPCYPGHACPGLYPAIDCSTTVLDDSAKTAIQDAGLIANAALRAISYGPSKSPAPHYDYFFSRDPAVVTFVTAVFTNVLACSQGRECRLSEVFCDVDPSRGYGWCPKTPNMYSYAPGGSHNTSAGGGSVFMCPAGLSLPRNPVPCSTAGGAASIGYALVRGLVQCASITNPTDSATFFSAVGITGITEMGNAGVWSLSDLGWGTNGNGLMGKGVGNAENFAKFASLSWDYGYGGNPWTGRPCPSRWTSLAASLGLVPI